MAGAIDATLRKFHASLNVSDLERSIAFYRVLLGAEPAKVRSDYAKFDLAEPPLVLSLIPGRPGAGGNLNHVGLRVRNAEELVEIQRRLEAAGMPTEREEGVECCYARQTKFWITDPDRALWEIYVFHDDIDDHGSAAPPRAESMPLQVAAAESPAPRAWEHHLREPIPSRIPHDDNSLHEVRLEGSINVAPDAEQSRRRCCAESLRALRPGAPIYLHGLAGDRREPIGSRAAGPGRRGAARAGDERRRRRARSRRVRRDSDREALGDGVLRRRRRADARAADRGAQARSPAEGGGAPRGVSRADGAGRRTTSATCSVAACRRR